MSANTTSTCPEPFISSVGFDDGGYLAGRFCGANPLDNGTYCCLPCPAQQWLYSDQFLDHLKIPEWLSVVSLIACAFLLLSWIVLDPDKSQRHYLSVGLIVSIFLLQLAFVLPLAVKPQMCYDAITPKDMHNSMTCAWSGALFQAGGMSASLWIVLRSLWLHIRVVWDKSPGKSFLLGSLTAGILMPLVFLIAATLVSGYSFRLGSTCVINHQHGFIVFWGWIIAFAGVAMLGQCITVGWAGTVYWRHSRQEKARQARNNAMRTGGQGLTVDNNTPQNDTPANTNQLVQYNRLRWRKLRALFVLQWRQFAICMVVVINSTFLVTVFWSQDLKLNDIASRPDLQPAIALWSVCLTFNRGNKQPCLPLVSPFVSSPQTILASFILAALTGLEIVVILTRGAILTEWGYLLKRLFSCGKKRGSLDFNEPNRYPEQRFEPKPKISKSHHSSILDAIFGGNQFMGSSNRRMSKRFYSGNWAGPGREPSMRSAKQGDEEVERDSWGWAKRQENFVLGPLGEAHEGEEDERPRGSPTRLGSTVQRALVRDPRNRTSILRLETHAEALRRLARIEPGDRDSMVLGGYPLPGGDEEDGDMGGQKGQGRRPSSRSSFMSRGSRDSETLQQPVGQVTTLVNPLRMNRPSIAQPPTPLAESSRQRAGTAREPFGTLPPPPPLPDQSRRSSDAELVQLRAL